MALISKNAPDKRLQWDKIAALRFNFAADARRYTSRTGNANR